MVGSQSLMLLLGIVLLLFGGKKLPELAGALGKSMKEFRKSVAGTTTEDESQPSGIAESQTPVVAVQSRACAGCAAPLEPGWAHCPRCGAAVPPAPAASRDATPPVDARKS